LQFSSHTKNNRDKQKHWKSKAADSFHGVTPYRSY
jgi:hypothetical protein